MKLTFFSVQCTSSRTEGIEAKYFLPLYLTLESGVKPWSTLSGFKMRRNTVTDAGLKTIQK